jgi:hypothetical protein
MKIIIDGIGVLIDDEDYLRVSKYNWWKCNHRKGLQYFSRFIGRVNGKMKTEYLHRFIVNAEHGKDVDHINRDTLDNRKANLRQCSHSENLQNIKGYGTSTGHKGVYTSYNKAGGIMGYYSQYKMESKYIYVGFFQTVKEAADAYCKSAIEHRGIYARLE